MPMNQGEVHVMTLLRVKEIRYANALTMLRYFYFIFWIRRQKHIRTTFSQIMIWAKVIIHWSGTILSLVRRELLTT